MAACYAPIGGGIKRLCCLTSVCLSCTSDLSREQRGLGRHKSGTEVTHVTRDSDTIFKVERSKVKVTGRGHIVAASRTACLVTVLMYAFSLQVSEQIYESAIPLTLTFDFSGLRIKEAPY